MMILIVLFIWWTSPQPIDPASQRVVVTGGVLQSMTVADDGRSGQIWINAPRECASIDWTARSITGLTFHTIRAWRDQCDKVYLPLS